MFFLLLLSSLFFFFFFTIYTALHCRFSFYGLAVLWLPVWCHLNHKNVLKEIVFTDFSDGLCMTMKMRDHWWDIFGPQSLRRGQVSLQFTIFPDWGWCGGRSWSSWQGFLFRYKRQHKPHPEQDIKVCFPCCNYYSFLLFKSNLCMTSMNCWK